MLKQTSRIEYQSKPVTFVCPMCQQHSVSFGRMNFTAGSTKNSPNYAIKNPVLEDCSEFDVPEVPFNLSAIMCQPIDPFSSPTINWAHHRYAIGLSCPNDHVQMIAIDSKMSGIYRLLNSFKLYVVDCSSGDTANTAHGYPKAIDDMAYIEFFHPIPFWLWGRWRNVTLSDEKSPALHLERSGRMVVFNCTGAETLKVIEKLINELNDEVLGNMANEYNTIIRHVFAPTLYHAYNMYATDSIMHGDEPSPLDWGGSERALPEDLPGKYVETFVLHDIVDGLNASVDILMEQIDVYIWETFFKKAVTGGNIVKMSYTHSFRNDCAAWLEVKAQRGVTRNEITNYIVDVASGLALQKYIAYQNAAGEFFDLRYSSSDNMFNTMSTEELYEKTIGSARWHDIVLYNPTEEQIARDDADGEWYRRMATYAHRPFEIDEDTGLPFTRAIIEENLPEKSRKYTNRRMRAMKKMRRSQTGEK